MSAHMIDFETGAPVGFWFSRLSRSFREIFTELTPMAEFIRLLLYPNLGRS